MSAATEKKFSFHGASMTRQLAVLVQNAWNEIKLVKDTKPLQLRQNESATWYADMDHNFQKYHEEDAVAAVMDAMAMAGWKFRFQYDSELNSSKLAGSSSFSRREMFVFEQ